MNDLTGKSKYLSLLLRHSPQAANLDMDSNGWVAIQQIEENTCTNGKNSLSGKVIREIVKTDSKQRYMISPDGNKIRASQGHSIQVDLVLDKKEPPDVLYHGTAERFLASIMENGLKPMGRQYVHLSVDTDTAQTVGVRHGKPVVLSVDAKAMYKDGHDFYLSDNNIWMTATVPRKYLTVGREKKIAERTEINKNLPFASLLPKLVPAILGIKKKDEIQKIYLFGSYAYGKPTKESDIDLCVVTSDNYSKYDCVVDISNALRDIGIKYNYDLLVCKCSQFYNSENPESVENTIINKGVLLYER